MSRGARPSAVLPYLTDGRIAALPLKSEETGFEEHQDDANSEHTIENLPIADEMCQTSAGIQETISMKRASPV